MFRTRVRLVMKLSCETKRRSSCSKTMQAYDSQITSTASSYVCSVFGPPTFTSVTAARRNRYAEYHIKGNKSWFESAIRRKLLYIYKYAIRRQRYEMYHSIFPLCIRTNGLRYDRTYPGNRCNLRLRLVEMLGRFSQSEWRWKMDRKFRTRWPCSREKCRLLENIHQICKIILVDIFFFFLDEYRRITYFKSGVRSSSAFTCSSCCWLYVRSKMSIKVRTWVEVEECHVCFTN